MNTYVVFDFETTGLNSATAEIIEISAIKVNEHSIIDEFTSLVKSKGKIPPEVSALTGITQHMLTSAPCIEEVLPQFLNFICDYNLLGYNIATFDLPILRRVLSELYNKELPNYYEDVVYLARKKLQHLPSRSLSNVAAYLGISAVGAHRALNDCIITHKVYEKLKDMKACNSVAITTPRTPKPKSTYTDATKALQTLHGFLLGVIADEILTESEVLSLKKWLDSNSSLAGQYPFDRIFSCIEKALDDGLLEQTELDELLCIFKQCTSPVAEISCSIETVKGKTFCLTGDFEVGSRKEVESMISNAGGICKNSVTSKTNYVVIGNLGSPDWSCGNYGNKVKKALELRSNGKNIEIAKEPELLLALEKNAFSCEYPDCSFVESESFYDKLQKIIDQLIASHNLPENSIHLYSNLSTKGDSKGIETSKSLCIFEPDYPASKSSSVSPGKNFIIMNIKNAPNNTCELLIRNKQFDSISLPASAVIKPVNSDKSFVHVVFNSDDNQVLEYVKNNIVYCLNNYEASSSFGCCSRFVECSDAKMCVHENKIYSMGCKYRKNLDAGKIFYGKNRNI